MARRVLLYIPVVISLILLGAHFLRYGIRAGVVVSLVLIAMLAVRVRWVPWLIQAALVTGSLVWTFTLYELVQMRVTHGQPYARMAFILVAVSVFTLCSALVFQSDELRRIYGSNRLAPPDDRA